MMQMIFTSETSFVELIKRKLFCFVCGKNHSTGLTLVTLVTLVGEHPKCTDNVSGHRLLLWD